MRPPRLWAFYCGVLGVPPRLQMGWWQALRRSRRSEARAMCDEFERLSTRTVVHGDFLKHEAGPGPMVRLLELCVKDGFMSRTMSNKILTYILDFTTVEATKDWRGVAIPCQRWLTEHEVKEKRSHGTKTPHQRRV